MERKIALFDAKPYDKTSFEIENSSFHFDITYFETKLTKQTATLAKGFPVICIFVHDHIDKELMEILYEQGVRLITLRSNGYNHVDIASSSGKIAIVHVPRYSPYAVAEFTVATMLALNRKLYLSYARTKLNNFSLNGLVGFDMHGKTVGIIGSGQIGSIVVKILSAFGMRVLVYDVYQKEELVRETGCEYTSLSNLLAESDIISLHCPLTKENHHLINKKTLHEMKKGVLLVNTGRGGLIHTSDLIDTLKSQQIGGAALDVYEEEERFFFKDLSSSFIDDDVLARLMTFPNVLLTSHQAFFTKEALEQIAKTTLQNVLFFYEKKPLLHLIT